MNFEGVIAGKTETVSLEDATLGILHTDISVLVLLGEGYLTGQLNIICALNGDGRPEATFATLLCGMVGHRVQVNISTSNDSPSGPGEMFLPQEGANA